MEVDRHRSPSRPSTPSNNAGASMSARPSRSNSASSHTNNGSLPFGSLPTAPRQLGFGFGMAAPSHPPGTPIASTSGSFGLQALRYPALGVSNTFVQARQRRPSETRSTVSRPSRPQASEDNARRRKRSETPLSEPEEDEDEEQDGRTYRSVSYASVKGTSKRLRRDHDPMPSESTISLDTESATSLVPQQSSPVVASPPKADDLRDALLSHFASSSLGTQPASATIEQSLASAGSSDATVQDLSTSLQSLTKPALLRVLEQLIKQQPQLSVVVSSLLPFPTIESVQASLDDLERAVASAIPLSFAKGKQRSHDRSTSTSRTTNGIRDDYIWSRVRTSLEAYIVEVARLLDTFFPAIPNDDSEAWSPRITQAIAQHPSTQFGFLYSLTLSVRKLEAVLPVSQAQASSSRGATQDPLSRRLLPDLFAHWRNFECRIGQQVNEQGKLLAASIIQTWFRQLDHLASSRIPSLLALDGLQGDALGEVTLTQQTMQDLQRDFVRDIGWTIGVRAPADMRTTQEL
ncbi:uncharacterized protein L969DRAFT_96104 [Mixia osmundae IAM 14324]|uniref:Tethering factor for nuclear proteasome STS1 n=1 Tax=Mixia osmundae (strain CBS 9802 / IAM 14324 / JCM 22182 / KY 12970) TaxID=764103 RepID=G7DT06_MIXOS|nr:uncharacterized protein L969DRAFT_96104 [Mixia osmundae IAM 14324]KEI37574.1 hypothetical protein L969DRAFT_96104 [Mixia osmundae IAM 14324]GAA93716.1 hypothetical protein E5Q_00362 [Mixia osmundae IAM 14324]